MPQFFDHESEAMILSAMMQSSPTIERLMTTLNAGDFERSFHADIFADIVRLHKSGMLADLVAVGGELKKSGKVELVPELAEISGLTNCVANVDYYVGIVKDLSVKRAALRIIADAKDSLNDTTKKGVDITGEIEKQIAKVNLGSCGTDYKHVSNYMPDVCTELDRTIATMGAIKGVEAPFEGLKDLMGFRDGEYSIIAARPSIGKTALALNLIEDIAIKRKIACGFFSVEMSARMLNFRMISSIGGLNSNLLMKGMYRAKHDKERIERVLFEIAESPIYIDDTSGLKLSELKTKARRMVRVDKCKIIFIDYIGLLDAEEPKLPRHEQIALCSRTIKSLAKELDIPIVALSQVLRDTEGKRPNLSSLAETRSLEQDADLVMFLHRERADDPTQDNIPTELIVAKQRNGPTGICNLIYKPRLTKFVDAV